MPILLKPVCSSRARGRSRRGGLSFTSEPAMLFSHVSDIAPSSWAAGPPNVWLATEDASKGKYRRFG
eukprot:4649494-Prymnesium_polylepis.1